MPSWDTDQYLKFSDERTRPAFDLVARVKIEAPRRVIDLGCGPGNSTEVLARRWPHAQIIGLDSSPAMIAGAQRDYPERTWLKGDISTWSAESPFEVIFSNAALQWVPDHSQVVPRLFSQLVPGGALAVQVPGNFDCLAHRLMRQVAATAAWEKSFPEPVREWRVEEADFYYDVLSREAAAVDLWRTEYFHVMKTPQGILEWYRGTGLRPFLDQLVVPEEKNRFLADYLAEVTRAFPSRSDGKVLFPFQRLFFIAYRAN